MLKAKDILTSCEKFHITLGLERIKRIMELLDNPQDTFKSIHIAGTNGKGSCAAIINQILIENFKNTDTKIGLFTSPHLFSYNERIKVNNEKIPDYILDKLANKINDTAKQNNIELSEFELITAVAFFYFYIKKVSYVVLEVGLGGKFDATNIVRNSPIQIITTIDFDHTDRLGSTIEEIAVQKAGIIKSNSKVVVSKSNPGYNTIEKTAKEKKAKIVELKKVEIEQKDKNYAYFDNKKFVFSLLGAHQKENLALALSAVFNLDIGINEDALEKGLKNVKWPFRNQYNKEKNILIDGAHNPSGIQALKNFLDENFKNIKKKIYFGCLKTKNHKTMMDILINKEDEFYFIEFNHQSALLYDELEEKYKKIFTKTLINEKTLQGNELKVFCGSLYMLGEIFNSKNIIL